MTEAKLSKPLESKISEALLVLTAYAAWWVDSAEPERQAFVRDAESKGCRLFVALFPETVTTLSVGLLEQSGSVIGLGAVTFDQIDARH